MPRIHSIGLSQMPMERLVLRHGMIFEFESSSRFRSTRCLFAAATYRPRRRSASTLIFITWGQNLFRVLRRWRCVWFCHQPLRLTLHSA
jgi:hypothetical protein